MGTTPHLQTGKRKNGLAAHGPVASDPSLGRLAGLQRQPNATRNPRVTWAQARNGGSGPPGSRGGGPSWGLRGMRGCGEGSLVPSPMTPRGPRVTWVVGHMDGVQPLAVMGPPQAESPERSGWDSCAHPRLHIAMRETSCLPGTRAESPCSLLVKGPQLGRRRTLGAAPNPQGKANGGHPCCTQGPWMLALTQPSPPDHHVAGQ